MDVDKPWGAVNHVVPSSTTDIIRCNCIKIDEKVIKTLVGR